jgi:hypothetical protein
MMCAKLVGRYMSGRSLSVKALTVIAPHDFSFAIAVLPALIKQKHVSCGFAVAEC